MMKRLSVLAFMLIGAMTFAQGQPASEPAEAPIQDNDTTPFHVALVNYKSGNYEKARTAIDEALKANPGDAATQLLKARILTEQKEYADAEKLLRSLLPTPASAENPAQVATGQLNPFTVQVALGDLLLREHSFDRAAKYYALALQAKPNEPDITLKMVYAKVGTSDLVSAGKYASTLSPMDPKNPYDDHASYYFARAALAQATGDTTSAENDIQTARTVYGITVANRYLRTYLQVFASTEKNSDVTPAPLVKPAPSGKQ